MAPCRCSAKDCFNSQITTKGISYFAFPRSEYYACKWAMAAGREDLLNKPLHTIIKYYLCSEHFTNDCFADPQTKTRLKKSTKPIHAPIPTIFRNNISKFMPTRPRKLNQNTSAEVLERYHEIKSDTMDSDSDIQYASESDKQDTSDSSSREPITTIFVIPEQLIDPSQNREERQCDDTRLDDDDIVNTPKYELAEESTSHLENVIGKQVCRLCAQEMENLTPIFVNMQLIYALQIIMPQQIREGDEYSQYACEDCVAKAMKCLEIIEGFHEAQMLQVGFCLGGENDDYK